MHFRELREGDLEYLGQHLRSKEAQILAAKDASFHKAVNPTEIDRFLVMDDGGGKPAALFLARRLADIDDEDSAFVWLVAGEALEKHPAAFMRACRGFGQQLLAAGPWQRVWSRVDMANRTNCRFAQWGGFVVERENVADETRPGHLFYQVVCTRGEEEISEPAP